MIVEEVELGVIGVPGAVAPAGGISLGTLTVVDKEIGAVGTGIDVPVALGQMYVFPEEVPRVGVAERTPYPQAREDDLACDLVLVHNALNKMRTVEELATLGLSPAVLNRCLETLKKIGVVANRDGVYFNQEVAKRLVDDVKELCVD